MFDLPASADLREVGLRDGLQLEAPVPTEDKLAVLDALVAAGLKRIEVTSFVSPRAVPALADAAEVAAALDRHDGVRFTALVAGTGGARRAVEAGMRDLQYVVSASEGHSQANARRSTAEAVAAAHEVVGLARQAGGQVEVSVSTAWDCPFDGPTPVERVLDVVRGVLEAGAERVCLADTIGTALPGRVVALVEAVREAVPGVALSAHFHDTRGAGVACSLAALSAGITQLDGSVGGLGGCPFAPGASGNVATEELVRTLEGSGVATGIDLDALLRAADRVEAAVGHPLQSSLHRAHRAACTS